MTIYYANFKYTTSLYRDNKNYYMVYIFFYLYDFSGHVLLLVYSIRIYIIRLGVYS